MNTTEYVHDSVTDTSISKGVGAAIGFSAIFGFVVLGGLCFVIILRRRPAEKEQLPMRRPSTIVIREPVTPASRRPSVVGREPVTPASRRPSVVAVKSEV